MVSKPCLFMVIVFICGLYVFIYMAFLNKLAPLPSFHPWQSPVGGVTGGPEWNTLYQSAQQEEDSNTRSTVYPTSLTVSLPSDLTFITRNITNDIKPATQKKLIMIFNRPGWLFDGDPYYQKVFSTCPYTCDMTDDRRRLPNADAVWVHLCRLNDKAPPSNRPAHQIWVAYCVESPLHYLGLHDSPAWKNVFNWTFGYRTDSDLFCPYNILRLRTQSSSKNYTQIMVRKTKPIAWFVSNCHSSSKREEYVKELKKYVNIDIYGLCGNLSCPYNEDVKCLELLNTTYYFYLAFENSFCQDYVTEKLFKTFRNVDVIPIVRGGFNYAKYLPPNNYLNTANFTSPQHLATYLQALMKDVPTYTGMLRAKDHFYTHERNTRAPTDHHPFCQFCRNLQMSPVSPKVYPDIMMWTRKNQCWAPTDV